VIARSIPGDSCHSILGEKATEETCDQFMEDQGLNEPVYVQFFIFLRNLAQGNLGDSIRFSRPVTLILVERLPTTIELGFAAMTLAVLIGLPLGIISAVRRNSVADVGTMIGANLGVSIPVFFLGLMLIYIFAVLLRDTPLQLPPSDVYRQVYRLPPSMKYFSMFSNLYPSSLFSIR
jgi:peptide/nickel transport system permease protein